MLSLNAVFAQAPGTIKTENHPALSVSSCALAAGGKPTCTPATKSLTIDSDWRWLHGPIAGGSKNCYENNSWDKTLCPTAATCTHNCAMEGADNYQDYGISTSGGSAKLNFVTQNGDTKSIGSRSFLLEDDKTYKIFKLKNREFTFDVDVSKLPCGLNGALYFVQMDADGGSSKYFDNTAGAAYGTGYCDAACPHDIKFIDGQANSEGWAPSPTNPSSGIGPMGSCCAEMDVWQANSISEAFSAHPCTVKEQTKCTGVDCGDNPDHRADGVCAKNGCDFEAYRLGNTTFFGPGATFTIDTTKPITVTTQFITSNATDAGTLTEVRRSYKQGGKTIQAPTVMLGKAGPFSGLSFEYCTAEAATFTDNFTSPTDFTTKGGFASMDDALEKGMVLVMAIRDDYDFNMTWLDSTFPAASTAPGAKHGACATTSGVPKDVETNAADATVTFSNIKFGPIGSTNTPPPPPPATGPFVCHIADKQCVQDPTGDFPDKASCDAKCAPAPPKFACHLSTNQCVQDPAGEFPDQASCTAKCSPPPAKYACHLSTNTCAADPAGEFPDEASCTAKCKSAVEAA